MQGKMQRATQSNSQHVIQRSLRTAIRHQLHRNALAAALIVTMIACNKTADAPKAASGPALPDGKTPALLISALDSATMVRMEQRTGDWSKADASSTWRAMASGGKIRLIDESQKVGDMSSRRITYYFTDDGKLAAYAEFRIQTVLSGNKPPEKQYVLFKLEFQSDTVSRTEKNVNGASQPVEPFEIENVRKHAAVLFSAAQTAPVSSPAKP